MTHDSFRTRRRHSLLALALAPMSLCGSAFAATDTWAPPATPLSNNWNDPSNWGGTAPSPQDLLVFTGINNTTANDNYANGIQFNGITFDANAAPFTLTGNSIQLGIQPSANRTAATSDIVNLSPNAQTVSLAGLTLNTGKHTISTATAGLNITSPITQSPGNAIVFTSTGGGVINVNGTGLANDTTGIIGGQATFGTSWASLDANNNIVAYTGYTDVTSGNFTDNALSNVRIPTPGAAISAIDPAGANPNVTHINSLQFGNGNTTAVQTVNILTGNTLVLGQNGGIFNATGVTGTAVRNLTIDPAGATGMGTITAGDGIHPATITLSSSIAQANQTNAGIMTINSVIADNTISSPGNTGKVSLVISGGYVTLNQNAAFTGNTFTGGIYILSGRLSQVTQLQVAQNHIFVFPGVYMNIGVPLTNDMTVAGNGVAAENNGVGALRLFGNSVLSGNITLSDTATIDSNGSGTGTLGVSGKITGPGGLSIGSPTTNSNNGTGTVFIGATTGTVTPNDYAGDTTINAAASGASVGAGLKIGASADNNIMPHGLTGSFSGGPTGNVILNATAATGRTATFDLNGSTQTINGLSSTASAATGNIVASSLPGAMLVVGDSNANGSFGGIIQDSTTGGTGTLALSKIGNGTQTLSGTNTYSGGTTVNAGTLVAASTGALGKGTLTVHSGATVQLQPGLSAGVVLPIPQIDGATGAWTGTLDVTNNKVIVEDSVTHATTFAQLQNQVNFGKTHSAGGISSSTGLPAGYGVAVLDNATFNKGSFGGTTVDSNAILVGPELLGDANVDGTVDMTDLNTILSNFGATTASWTSGNFDGHATIDLTDLAAVLNNFGQTNSTPFVATASTAGPAVAPEPASLALAGISVLALALRRRRI